MKKNISFIILIAWGIILIFAGCKGNSSTSISNFESAPNLSSLTSAQTESATSEFSSSSEGIESEITDPETMRELKLEEKVLAHLDNTTPYNELITEEIDINEFYRKYVYDFIFHPKSFGDMDKDFKIECLRENEAGYFYSVHKVKQGGLLYIFYLKYHYAFDFYYVTKPISKSDFSIINENSSTIEDVEKVDPATTIYKEYVYDQYIKNPHYKEEQIVMTSHYLTDSSCFVTYQLKNDRLIVDSMEFFPYDYDEIEDFQFMRTDWHILPQDYLPAGG